MAKRADKRTFNVSVLGLSGTEKDKGADGIGKSCMCNRFMRPLADDYYKDHISVLSQSDFGGRVVNNDHFLYWGEVTKTDEGVDYAFHVVEQTEFIDDSSFLPFKSGKPEPYYRRCAATKLQSAEKLMYICKNQLGLEHEFEQKMLPEGKLNIDGFLCLFDVSVVHQRSFDRQVEQTMGILSNLIKTKKPIVFVTTKNDVACETYVRDGEKLINKLKGNIPIVETSAHQNVNIEQAFLALAHLIDRTKGRPKISAYADAARARKEVLDVASEAYKLLLRTQVTEYKALWIPVHRKLLQNADYNHFVDLFGTDKAKRFFRDHVRSLREEFLERTQEKYLERLRTVLKEILPDLAATADRSWPATMRWLQRQDFFDDYFVNIPEGLCWQESDIIENMEEKRIPFDLLESNEAENCFRNHVNILRAEHKRAELRKQFKQLLRDNHNVGPGKSLSEVAIFFLGRECFTMLSEEDKQSVYEHHQRELKEKARQDFIELLLENPDLFQRLDPNKFTNEDLKDITDKLTFEPRYKALARLDEERRVMIQTHVRFVYHPSRDRCPYRDSCKELLVEQLLANKAHRPQSWSNNSHFLLDSADNRLNLVLLGSDGLAYQLVHEIRLNCVDDDQYLLDNQLYSLDYRPIDGDVTLPQNSFRTQDFVPHGCFCVFNSMESMDYLRVSLEKTLMSDLDREDRLPFQGLPVVVVLAHNTTISEKGLLELREEGQALADRLQCPFIDIPSAMMEHTENKFHKDQIELAMHALVESIKHRSSFVKPWPIAESIEPDIRILMCFMCGDTFNIELPLAPLLNHQCCYVTSDRHPTITLETFLDESKRKVEVTILSYHGASGVRDELYHGYILVYSTKRKASLQCLKSFSHSLPRVPVKLLAVTESGGANAFFSSDYSQGLLTEGNALADRLTASFMTTCPNFQQQTASYTPFFKEAWDRKSDTESAFTFSSDETPTASLERQPIVYEHVSMRPPATLPKPPPRRFETFTGGKISNSISLSMEESEPVYDTPHIDPGSESDEAGSSTSPCDTSPYNTGADDLYSEIPSRDTDQLIKPSQLKSRRNLYAERQNRKSFPSASRSFRDDSTDTDSSLSTPKTLHVERSFDSPEPHYQFRKSSSMKLALKERDTPEEGWHINSKIERIGKKLTKSSTLPATATPPCSSDKDPAWYEDAVCDATPLLSQMENQAYDKDGSKPSPPPPIFPKPKIKAKPLDHQKFENVERVLNRNLTAHPGYPLVKAPLATPEQIEIGDYAQVKDALSPAENDYALVHDALPAGKMSRVRLNVRKKTENSGVASDSDSEFSSLERERKEDLYSRVNRRPTPHKKKNKPRYSDSCLPPPPLPPFSEERHLYVPQDQMDKDSLGVRSNSFSEGSEGTGDELHNQKKQKKRRSIRGKNKKSKQQQHHHHHHQQHAGQDSPPITGQPWSDSDLGMTPSPAPPGHEDDPAYACSGGREYLNRYGDGDTEELMGRDQVDWDWKKKLKIRLEKDVDKNRRKEEKRLRDEERKKLKEEEKRQKEQQKLQRKRKKEGKQSTSSASSIGALEDLSQSEENLLPLFVVKCITFIENEGLTVEGIYRVPGNKAHVDLLQDRFKEDPNVDIHSLDIPVNAVATALKGFFSELSEPLISSYLHNEMIEAASRRDRRERITAIREVMHKLPKVNWQVLNYLVDHINKVTEHSAENSMDSKNLAICWWPTLLRPEFTSFEKMTMVSKYLEEIVQCVIDNADFFFHGGDISEV